MLGGMMILIILLSSLFLLSLLPTSSSDIVSLMVVGPTGVGKSSLLNSLLCPAKYTQDYEDCHFRTEFGQISVTKKIAKVTSPWLQDREPVTVFDTPGLGDTDGVSDAETLKEIVEIITSTSVNALLLVFRADGRFNQNIQKQLRTLEYVLGNKLWDHVITVLTFWGFGAEDIQERIRNCIMKRKANFTNIMEARDFCEQFDFETEMIEAMSNSYKRFLGVTQTIPFAFPHPVFKYNVEEEKSAFFANAKIIYDNALNMTAVSCDENCQERLEIALKSERSTPFIVGRKILMLDAGEELYLECNLYLGLGDSTEREIEIRWWHDYKLLDNREIRRRGFRVEERILLDVTKESRLIIENARFENAGKYECSTTEKGILKKSLQVSVKVLERKF